MNRRILNRSPRLCHMPLQEQRFLGSLHLKVGLGLVEMWRIPKLDVAQSCHRVQHAAPAFLRFPLQQNKRSFGPSTNRNMAPLDRIGAMSWWSATTVVIGSKFRSFGSNKVSRRARSFTGDHVSYCFPCDLPLLRLC